MDQGKTGIRRAAWRLTSVPGCDGNGGMGSGEIAGGSVNRLGLLEERGLMQDCYSVTTSTGVVKVTTGTEKERVCWSYEGDTSLPEVSPGGTQGLLRWSPHPYQSKSRDLASPQEMLNPLKEPRAGWKRDF